MPKRKNIHFLKDIHTYDIHEKAFNKSKTNFIVLI